MFGEHGDCRLFLFKRLPPEGGPVFVENGRKKKEERSGQRLLFSCRLLKRKRLPPEGGPVFVENGTVEKPKVSRPPDYGRRPNPKG